MRDFLEEAAPGAAHGWYVSESLFAHLHFCVIPYTFRMSRVVASHSTRIMWEAAIYS